MTRLKLIRLLAGHTIKSLAEYISAKGSETKLHRQQLLYAEKDPQEIKQKGGWQLSVSQLEALAVALDSNPDQILENVERGDILIRKGRGNL